MFRSTTTPSPSPPPDYSCLCALSVSARAPLPLHRHPEPSEGSAFLSSLATTHSPLAAMFFRITSFADTHHTTSIESHLCKKQGGGVSQLQPNHFLFFPHRTRTRHTASPATPILSCNCAHFPSHMGVYTPRPLVSLFHFRISLCPSRHSSLVTHHFLRTKYLQRRPRQKTLRRHKSPAKKSPLAQPPPSAKEGLTWPYMVFKTGLPTPVKCRARPARNSVCGKGVALWRAGGKDRFDSRHCIEIQRATPGKCHEAADTSRYAYQMRETGRQGIHNSKESLAQPRVVGQPHDHARQDAIVKEKRPACALKLPEPGIILTYAVGNVPVQQFGSHQCLSHAAAGNGIEEPRGVAKQHKPRGHATAGLGSQRRGCEQRSRLFGPFQTLGKLWFRKQPTAEGALDRFSELLRICQHGDEHFTPGQRGYI